MKQPSITTRTGNVLDSEHIGKLLVKLSIPAFLGMFVQTMYNVINTIFVGHYVGPLGIAGLSIVFPLQMLGMGMGMMVGVGGMSLISRYIGSKEIPSAEKALGNGLTISIGISILVMLIILPFIDFWLRLIGSSDAVLPYAKDYLTIIMYSLVFQVIGTSLLNYSRAEGNARVAMVAMILGAVANIIFDAVFIIWLGMGVKGAAWATFISQAVSVVYFFFFYFNGNSYLKIRAKNLRLDFAILKPMFAIGAGAFMQTVASSISALILMRAVVEHGGDYALSAFGILQRVFMFGMMPGMVLAQGAQPILGFNYGAKRFHLALKVTNLALLVSTSLSIAGFLTVYFIPGPIASIFTIDQELIRVSIDAARILFFGMPLIGVINVGTMMFQAIGRAVPAFIAAVVRQVFLIGSVLLLPRLWGLDGVWSTFPISDFLTFLLIMILVAPIISQFRKAANNARKDEDQDGITGRMRESEKPVALE